MSRYKGRIRRQNSFQVGDTITTTSGSDADLESLISMDTFTDAKSSSPDGRTRLPENIATSSSTLPLIDRRQRTEMSQQRSTSRMQSNEQKTWKDYLPGFLKSRKNAVQNLPTLIYNDGNGSSMVEPSIRLESVSNGEQQKRRRISPSKSRSKSMEAMGCYFSDGIRLIDYVLVYDLDHLKGSDDGDSINEDTCNSAENPQNDGRPVRQSNCEKRRIFETNLQRMGLELEYTFAKHSRTGFVLLHAPFKVLMKQAELLKIKMPVNQNDVKKHANLMDGVVNKFLQRFRFMDFNDKIKERIEPVDYFCQPFIEQHLDCFINNQNPIEFFCRSQRSRMVYDILIRTRYDSVEDTSDKLRFGIERLIRNNAYSAYYPIHEELEFGGSYSPETCSTRKLLYETWVKPKNFCKYQPLHVIKDYFGTKIGFYFAWLGYYTRFLYAVSILGILCFLYGLFAMSNDLPSNQICDANDTRGGAMILCPICDTYCDYTQLSKSCIYSKIAFVFDNLGTVIFASLVSVWATLFLEGWKRYHAELAYKWNVFDFEAEDEVLRPEFQFQRRKNLRLNPVTQNDEPYVPILEQAVRYTFSGISVLFFICMILALVFGIVLYRLSVLSVSYQLFYDKGDVNFKIPALIFTSVSAACINLVFILIMNLVYNKLAMTLTELECPRTQSEFDNSYTFKVFMFQFINYYSSLAYIAFVKGRFGNVPEDKHTVYGYRMEQCDPSGCMVELVIQLFIIMTGKQVVNAFMETVYPIALNHLRRIRLNIPETKAQRLNRLRQESNAVFEAEPGGVSLVEKDYALNPVSEQFLFDEYLEMVIQFGFCTLFVSAFPLAPFFALLNNILEIRLDAYKFIVTQRKPMPLPARSIGIWYTILDLISKLSVLCNACIIGFTSDFVPKLYYLLNKGDMNGYIEDSMSYYDARHIYLHINTSYPNTTICRFKSYRQLPCSLVNESLVDAPPGEYCGEFYAYSNHWWTLFAYRLIFVIVFEHLVLVIKAIFSYIIPDIPTRIVIQLQRERYLARQAVLRGSDDNSNTPPRAQNRVSSGEDTDAVAHQTGEDALEGQSLEPSSALKRIYSNRKRPSLSPHASATNLSYGSNAQLSPKYSNKSLMPDRLVISSDSDSFLTALTDSPIQKSSSMSNMT